MYRRCPGAARGDVDGSARVCQHLSLLEGARRGAPEKLLDAEARRLEGDGRSRVRLLRRDQYGAAGLPTGDAPKPVRPRRGLPRGARRAPVMMTGDNPGSRRRLARELQIDGVMAACCRATRRRHRPCLR